MSNAGARKMLKQCYEISAAVDLLWQEDAWQKGIRFYYIAPPPISQDQVPSTITAIASRDKIPTTFTQELRRQMFKLGRSLRRGWYLTIQPPKLKW